MRHTILEENHQKRLDLPFWKLFCFVMFCIWQMGFIYFTTPALNIDGRTPIPVNMDNITLLIVSAYIASIAVMMILPKTVVICARASAILALISAILWFFPLPAEIILYSIYIHCFACCFMIGFETATIVYYFSEKSTIRHLLLAYPIGHVSIAVIQNDIAPISFSVFKIIIVIMVSLIILFFFSFSGKTMPTFVKKSDGFVSPKRFLTGIMFLCFLGSIMGVVGPAVAAETKHGVVAFYIGAALSSLIVYLIYKIAGIHPIRLVSVVIGITVIGYALVVVSIFVPSLALISCALIGSGMLVCGLVPLFGLLITKEYPHRFIAPGIISLAMIAVIIHSTIIEIFRGSVLFLNLTYLLIMICTAFAFIISEPYLIYALKRSFITKNNAESEQAAAVSDIGSDLKNDSFILQDASPSKKQGFSDLTKRELEVVELISMGHTNSDIARMLYISEHTVKDHTKSIYRKLGVHSRYELIALVNRINNQ